MITLGRAILILILGISLTRDYRIFSLVGVAGRRALYGPISDPFESVAIGIQIWVHQRRLPALLLILARAVLAAIAIQ